MPESDEPGSDSSTHRRAVLASVGTAVATSGLATAVPGRETETGRDEIDLGLIDGIEEPDSVEALLDREITLDDIDASQIDTTERPGDIDADRLSDLDPGLVMDRLTDADLSRLQTVDVDPVAALERFGDVTLDPPANVDRAQLVDAEAIDGARDGTLASVAFDPDDEIQPGHRRVCGTTPWAWYSPFPGPNANGCSFPLSDAVLNTGCCNKHDRCYADGGGPARRAYCDVNFFRCQVADPRVPLGAAWTAYTVVRAFGRFHFNYC